MHTIRCDLPGQPYVPHFLTCVGAGRANEGLRAAFREHLALTQEKIGFSYLRFHALFHDDMFVMRKDPKGGYIFNFQYIDDLFDAMLDMHIRPFVELSFFPDCLKGGDATQCWWKGHVTPPTDFGPWCMLVDAFVRHVISRYGIDEVRTWYFEVWNEPNLDGFWDGTRSQYFDMYRQTALTIKAIDASLRVGGPATSNFVPDSRFDGEKEDLSAAVTFKVEDLNTLSWHGVWIEAFLSFCARNRLPVDFVSTHPYPTDFAFDSDGIVKGRSRNVDALKKDLLWLRDAVKNSAYPHAEIHLTEWSSSPSSRDLSHDFLQQAAFIVKSNLSVIGLTDSLSYWVFTDVFEEGGAGDTIFHGGFGMINYQGIVKPGFHAYKMLSRLKSAILYQDENAFITGDDSGVSGILYNYPIKESIGMSAYPDDSVAKADLLKGAPASCTLCLSGLKPHQTVRFEQLDEQHGWGYRAWQEMGAPEPPTREETRALREASLRTLTWTASADASGCITLPSSIGPWHVIQFETVE